MNIDTSSPTPIRTSRRDIRGWFHRERLETLPQSLKQHWLPPTTRRNLPPRHQICAILNDHLNPHNRS